MLFFLVFTDALNVVQENTLDIGYTDSSEGESSKLFSFLTLSIQKCELYANNGNETSLNRFIVLMFAYN